MVKHRKKVMVRKLKRYNRLKGLVGAILEYMEAPSPGKYEAIKALGYKDVTIKMYVRVINHYLASNNRSKGTTESLFNLVDKLKKPNVKYVTFKRSFRTVDRHELNRLVPAELERVIPIMCKHINEGAKEVVELCKPSTYKDSTLLKYLQRVRNYCKYRRSYHRNNSAIPSIIDKIEAKEGVIKLEYSGIIKSKNSASNIIAKYLLEHINEDYRSCLDYIVNILGYSLVIAKNYLYMFRKYIQSGTKVNNGYKSFYNYLEEYIKDYQIPIPIEEEDLDDKRYNYLKRLAQMYLNNEPLDKLSTTESQDIGSISLYWDKGAKTPIFTKEDYRDLNKIIKEETRETEEIKCTNKQDNEFDNYIACIKNFIWFIVVEGNNYADSVNKLINQNMFSSGVIRKSLDMIISYVLHGYVTEDMSVEVIDYLDKHNTYKVRQVLKESYCNTPVSTNRVVTEVNNKEGNLSMAKKRPESWGKPLTYEKYKEIAEMMKEIILNDEGPLDKGYFMKEYNLTYSQVRKLYSSLRCYMKKHSAASYRVAKAWNKAIKEVVKLPSLSESVKEVKDTQMKNEIAEQEPTCADTLNIKAGVIWNGFCSLLDNREQAIGFQKALKAFNVTNSHICRVTMEDPYNYEAIDEE